MTPLYVEDLLSMLNDRSVWAVAGYDGTHIRAIRHDGLVKLLQEKALSAKAEPKTISSAEIEAMNKDSINKTFGKSGSNVTFNWVPPVLMFDIPEGMAMTQLGESHGTYAAFRAQGWTDEQMLQHGYMRGKSAALDEVAEEIRKARANWPTFYNAHEGFAVLLEEVDELKSHVWTNQKKRDLAAMRKEAMQVAAMAICFMEEVCDEEMGRK